MKILDILSEGIASRRKEIRQTIENNKTKFQQQSSVGGIIHVIQSLFPNVVADEDGGAMSAGYKPSDDSIRLGNQMSIVGDDVFEQLDPEFAREEWDMFADKLANNLTHEIMHSDQYGRRRNSVDPGEYHKRRQRGIRNYADYLSQPDEISAYAEEIAHQLLSDHGSKQEAIRALQHNLSQYELGGEEAELDDSGLGKYMSQFGRDHKTRKALFKQVVQYIQSA